MYIRITNGHCTLHRSSKKIEEPYRLVFLACREWLAYVDSFYYPNKHSPSLPSSISWDTHTHTHTHTHIKNRMTFMYFFQHCFICRPSDSCTESEDCCDFTFTVRRSIHSARSHPQSARSHSHSARSHLYSATRLDLILTRLDLILIRLDLIFTRLLG